MGSWGINAFESDTGLDAVEDIRGKLPDNGELKLEDVIALLKQNEWYVPSPEYGRSHTGMEALAELMVLFMDGDLEELDWEEDRAKFSELSSFLAEKQDIKELRDYLADTLHSAVETEKENAADGYRYGTKWGGWYREKDWISWQEHMSALIQRLDTLLLLPENQVELVQIRQQSIRRNSEKPKEMFTIIKGKEADYQELRANNTNDPYSFGVIQYAERWGGMMEHEIACGKTVAEAAEKTWLSADTEGITGAMYGFAVSTLSTFWIHGDELYQWQMAKYDHLGGGDSVSSDETEDNQADETADMRMSL